MSPMHRRRQSLRRRFINYWKTAKARENVLEYFASRYGKQIRYDPPVDPWTAALWVVPAVLFAGLVLTALFLILRRKKEKPS